MPSGHARRRRRRGRAPLVTVVLVLLLAVAGLITAWKLRDQAGPTAVSAGKSTPYLGAIWYGASIEMDPATVRQDTGQSTPPPDGQVRVRVHLRIEVSKTSTLDRLAGCEIQLRAPDGRVFTDTQDFVYADRPDSCRGGTDTKPKTAHPKGTAQYFLRPIPGTPYEVCGTFVVPRDVADTARVAVVWTSRLPEYLEFPRQ